MLKFEELFKLKPKTLLKLRDSENTNLQLVEVETEVEGNVELKPITNHSVKKSPSKPSQDSIYLLVNALLSCDEDYVNQKIP